MIVSELKLNEERDNNSFIVNSTDLNNYKFYVSQQNTLNEHNRILYRENTQSISPINEFIKRNSFLKIFNTQNYDDNYNDNAYYEINKDLNKKTKEPMKINNDYNKKEEVIKY